MNRQRFPPTAYTVAWISALPIEAAAAAEMLDEAHHDPRNHGSMDQYVFGRIGHHNVVMACLPSGHMGTNSAAAVAGHLLGTFPCISFAFMVGIGGGVPSADVRLGDVVVGHPHLQHSGVVQYDFGKTGPEGQMRIGSLDAPPRALLNAIATLRSNRYRSLGNLARHLSVFDRLPQFCRNTAGEDILYDASYRHESGESCGGCSNRNIVKRHPRPGKDIMIHYGTIASGNQVIKDGVTRDKLSTELGGVLCFEMEAAGLVNVFKSVVIRGICDYADSHKNKRWQPYAAGTAAAVAKELLLLVPAVGMKATPEITGTSFNSMISTSRHQVDPATGTEDYRIRFSLKGVPLGRFADRPEDIRQLENTLLPEPDNCRRKILVLQGLGGIGKTQLAVEFARKHQTTFTSVFWLDGSSEDSLKQSFVQCLARIPVLNTERIAESPTINSGASAVRKAMEWLSLTGNKSWLLIFDNVDRDYEQSESDPYAYDLENYLPDVDHGSILITTRLAKLEQLGESLHLQTVDTAQAQAIFRKWYNRDFDPSDSGELLLLLDGLPLALAQAGAYMNETGASFSEYVKIYKEQWNDLMGAKATAALKSYRNRSINTTWMVSLHAIQSINRAAANLLLLWAHLDHKALPYWILERSSSKGLKEILTEWMGDAAHNEIKFQEIVRLLRNYGLVESAQEGSGHSTHPVVHQWAFHMQDEDQKSRLSRLALLIIGYAVPNEPTNELNNEFARSLDRLQKQLFPHAESWLEKWGGKFQEIIQHEDKNETKGLATALKEIGLLAESLDNPRKAETMYRLALHAQERVCGPDDLETLYIICVLAMLCTNRGNTREGETLCLRALEGYEKTYGSDYIYNKNALETLEILGVIYYAQGLPKKAEIMFQRALEGRNKAYGPGHVLTLQAVLNLGIVYSYENRHQEAESLFLQVLEGYEKAWGSEYIFTPAVLSALNNLGMGYNNQLKYEKAEEILKQALEGSEKAFGPYRTPTLATMTSLGLVYSNLDKLDEAEQMLDRALVGYERLWGPDYILTHPALDVVDYLSRVYFRQGSLDESEKMYQRSIEVKSRTWGADHPSTLGSMSGLASVYLSVGRLEEAEKLYRRAVKGYEMTFGTDDDPVWTDYQSLDLAHKYGWLLSHQGHLESARAMTMKALKGYEMLYGKGNQYFTIVQELLDQITSAMSASEGTSATKSLPLLFRPPPPSEVGEVDSGFKALSIIDVEGRRLEGGEDKRSSDDYVDHEKWNEEEDWEVVGT